MGKILDFGKNFGLWENISDFGFFFIFRKILNVGEISDFGKIFGFSKNMGFLVKFRIFDEICWISRLLVNTCISKKVSAPGNTLHAHDLSASAQSVTFVNILTQMKIRSYSYKIFDTNECLNKY